MDNTFHRIQPSPWSQGTSPPSSNSKPWRNYFSSGWSWEKQESTRKTHRRRKQKLRPHREHRVLDYPEDDHRWHRAYLLWNEYQSKREHSSRSSTTHICGHLSSLWSPSQSYACSRNEETYRKAVEGLGPANVHIRTHTEPLSTPWTLWREGRSQCFHPEYIIDASEWHI